MAELGQRGVEFACATLHIGPGTFQPVTDEHLRTQQLHEEYYSLQAGEVEQGLSVLGKFDENIRGVGLYKQRDQKLPGVYRPLTYVDMVLRNAHPEQFTRLAVHASCAHVEYVLKQVAHLGFFDRLRVEKLPLGTIVNKAQKQLPASLHENLAWFSKSICNVAKHDFDARENLEDTDSLDSHLFDLDEAIAIYLIARKLTVDLEESFLEGGVSRDCDG